MEEGKLSVEEVLRRTAEVLRAGPLCDDCLGRAFATLGRGFSNHERGRALRTLAGMFGTSGKPGPCWLCAGIFEAIPTFVERAAGRVEGIEFDSYLFGVRFTPRLAEMEAFFDQTFPTGLSEPLRHAFNREAGKAFEARVGHGTVDLTHPHVAFTIDLARGEIELSVLSLYVYGRYRKLARGIPQTHWPCRLCGGRGCSLCHETGKQYPESVEELVALPFLRVAGAVEAHLHGAGREDIDARMLGAGRPFVLEVVAPRCRTLDLARLEAEVNETADGKVAVSRLREVPREAVGEIKETEAEKTYRARVAFGEEVSRQALTDALSRLQGPIDQRTPRRVAHRRADLVRGRRVLAASGELASPSGAEITLRTEGGLYIKELVSGDEGRTVPSLTSLLGVPAQVVELDVLEVSSPHFPA
jgi:tRNA pseudouridine synthase 10